MKRRHFLHRSSLVGAGGMMLSMPALATDADNDNINHIGPKDGFTPLIGTLISQLDWLTDTVIRYHSHLIADDLDVVFDDDSNSIGALMMHLAATEVIYQDMTFYGQDGFSPANKEKWGVAMDLGKTAQEKSKATTLTITKKNGRP